MQIKNGVLVKNSNGEEKVREIDLKNTEIRTDLITELFGKAEEKNGIKEEIIEENDIGVRRVTLDEKGALALNRKKANMLRLNLKMLLIQLIFYG